jgi:NADH dehydrogenase
MKTGTVCLIGGSGFVGRHLAAHLSSAGWSARIPSRHPERQRDLCVLPGVQLSAADIHDAQTLRELCRDCDAVINLVGILNEKGHDGRGFQRAHVKLAEKIVAACREQGVPRLLHMSALNADARETHSHYLRTKGIAEDLVHTAATQDLRVTSFQPSVIFGPGDSFFNRFGALLKTIPVAFPLACPEALFAPVFVGDIAAAFIMALVTPATAGQRYALCGPNRYTLRQLVEFTARTLGLQRRIIGLSPGLSSLQSRVFEYLPGKPFSRDNYWSLQKPSICTAPFPEIFAITPSSIEAIVPGYLANRTARSCYDEFRKMKP